MSSDIRKRACASDPHSSPSEIVSQRKRKGEGKSAKSRHPVTRGGASRQAEESRRRLFLFHHHRQEGRNMPSTTTNGTTNGHTTSKLTSEDCIQLENQHSAHKLGSSSYDLAGL